MSEYRDPFLILSSIDVSEHIEKKNGLSYLSWAWAWAELMKRYPDSYTVINRDLNGMPFWTDGKTCWVDVAVILVYKNEANERCSRSRTEIFPVMDYKNKSIPLDKVTSFDINTSIQRGLTKAVARQGLGLYVYAGEDLPPEDPEKKMAQMTIDLTKIEEELKQYGFDRHNEKTIRWIADKVNEPTLTTLDPAVIVDTDLKLAKKVMEAYKAMLKTKKEMAEQKGVYDQKATF